MHTKTPEEVHNKTPVQEHTSAPIDVSLQAQTNVPSVYQPVQVYTSVPSVAQPVQVQTSTPVQRQVQVHTSSALDAQPQEPQAPLQLPITSAPQLPQLSTPKQPPNKEKKARTCSVVRNEVPFVAWNIEYKCSLNNYIKS